MRSAAARTRKDSLHNDGDSQHVLRSAEIFRQAAGQERHENAKTDANPLFAHNTAPVALPNISSLEAVIPAHVVAKEQGWLNKVIPAPERLLSDLFPCASFFGLKDKEWADGATADEVAIDLIKELHAWADKKHIHYEIVADENGYRIELEAYLDRTLQYDIYIFPLDYLFDNVWKDFSKVEFIFKGLAALIAELGLDGPEYWRETWFDWEYMVYADKGKEDEFKREVEPRYEEQESLVGLLRQPYAFKAFKKALNQDGLDLFWKDWGEMIVSVIECLGNLNQYEVEPDEYDNLYDESEQMPFADHFLVSHGDDEVWDFTNDILKERIGNYGFERPLVKISLHKDSVEEATIKMKDLSTKCEMLYNLGEVMSIVYNMNPGE